MGEKQERNRGNEVIKNKLYDYKKVRLEGGSVILTMGKNIPKEWKLVKIEVLDKDDSSVTLRIIKVA